MKANAHLLVLHSAIDGEELAGLRLFAGADLESAADILRESSMHMLRAGEVLLVPGTTNHYLYLLLCGRLRVHLDALNTDPVRMIESGETVGEISLIDEKPTSTYVVADTPSTVLALDRATFWSLVNNSHAVSRNMLLMVVERMRANNVQVADGMRAKEQLRNQTNVDELTGLRNARALVDLLRRQMLRSSMARKPLSLLMVDINDFKHFNHEFGTSAGDRALLAVAQMLQHQLRPTDIVARLDGAKFAVVLPECDERGAGVVAERVRRAVAGAVVAMADDSILPSVTVSIGITEMHPYDKAEDVMSAAEQALVQTKGSSCNAYLS